MGVGEVGDDLGVHDQPPIHDEVGYEDADELAVVEDFMPFLLVTRKALFAQLDNEGAFIELLIKAGPQGVEDLHGGADNDMGEVNVLCGNGAGWNHR